MILTVCSCLSVGTVLQVVMFLTYISPSLAMVGQVVRLTSS